MESHGTDGTTRARAAAGIGLLAAFVGGMFVAQAGGSDRETFLTLGFAFFACGFLGLLIGGVAIGIRLARD